MAFIDRNLDVSLAQEGANVFANALTDSNGETAVGGDIKVGARGVMHSLLCAIKSDFAGACDDFHAFCGGSAEVVFTWVDQTESFFRTIGKMHGVRNDFAFEVNVGFGVDCDLGV
jgi:hypothetical protein